MAQTITDLTVYPISIGGAIPHRIVAEEPFATATIVNLSPTMIPVKTTEGGVDHTIERMIPSATHRTLPTTATKHLIVNPNH